jgi:hypothetical protein
MPQAKPQNSASLPPRIFKPHGYACIELGSNYLLYQLIGPFNKELFMAIVQLHAKDVAGLVARGAWAGIAIIKNSAMTTPEALQYISEQLQQMREQGVGPVASAFVIAPDVEGAVIMAKRYAECYAGENFRIFRTLPEAQEWVKAQLQAVEIPGS